MTKIISIALTEQDALFLEEIKKDGSKASHIFRNALKELRRTRDLGIDLSEAAIAAKFKRFEDHIQKLNAFMTDNKLIQKYQNWESNKRAETQRELI